MKSRICGILAVTMLAAIIAAAQADWATVTRGAEYAFARGQMSRAETGFKTALEIAQGFPPGDRRLETSLENLGRFYEHRSEFAKAQPLYLLLLAAQEYRVGVESPVLLPTLFMIARVSQPLGDLPTVKKSLTRYDAIAEESGDADPAQWWQVLAMLARTAIIQEDEPAALAWQRRAVDVLEEDSNATGDERAVQLESLAQMELAAGEGPRAEQLYENVARIRTNEGEENALAETMAVGAETAYAAGEFATAERLALRCLDANPERPDEMTARAVLADVSWAEVNRGTDDLEILLAAASDGEELTVARERLRAQSDLEDGANSQTLSRLVQVETLSGRPLDAAKWQRQLIETAGADTVAMRLDLVTLLVAGGAIDEALAENAGILATIEAEYGPDDPRLIPLLGQRMNILIDAGRKKEAKKINKRLKKISK